MTIPRFASTSLQLSGQAYALCPGAATMQNMQAWTYEVWFNASSFVNDAQMLVSQLDSSSGQNFDGTCAVYVYGSQQLTVLINEGTNGPSMLTAPVSLTENTWHHAACTYDGSNLLTIYLDGVQVAQGGYAYVAPTASHGLYIGASNVKGYVDEFFQGMIGEVMVWNSCRSSDEIVNDSVRISYEGDPLDANLMLDLDFSVLPAVDWSGEGNDLSLEQGAQYSLSVPGLSLDGASYVDCGNAPDLSFGGAQDYTIEGWIYPSTEPSVWQAIVSKDYVQTTGEYIVNYFGDQIKSWRNNAGQILSAAAIVPGDFYHFSTTYDSAHEVLSLYINGNLQSRAAAPQMAVDQNTNLFIGASATFPSPLYFFTGWIQNIRLWNVCLDQSDVQQWMYNEPVMGDNVVASFDFTVDPPVDLTGKHAMTLQGNAACSYLSLPIAPTDPLATFGVVESVNAVYFNEDVVAPGPHPSVMVMPGGDRPAPFTEGFKRRFLYEAMGAIPPEAADAHRAAFESAYSRAEAAYAADPELSNPLRVEVVNGVTRLLHYGPNGLELIFETADAIDTCTVWWIGFIFKITIGFLQALGVVPSVGDIGTRIYNLVSNNATVVAAMNSLVGQTITATGAMTVLAAIYNQGYMWSIIKLALTSAGWWALAWVLKKVIAFATGLQAADTVAGLLVWAAQLTVISYNYGSSCSSTTKRTYPSLAPVLAS